STSSFALFLPPHPPGAATSFSPPPPQPASPTASPATSNASSKIQTARGRPSLILFFPSRSTMFLLLERSLIERVSVTQGKEAPAFSYQKPARARSASSARSWNALFDSL